MKNQILAGLNLAVTVIAVTTLAYGTVQAIKALNEVLDSVITPSTPE